MVRLVRCVVAQAIALYGVTHALRQEAVANVALDQVFIGARAHRLQCEGFVFLRRENDHGLVGSLLPHPREGLKPAAVGEIEIQQNRVKNTLCQPLETAAQVSGPIHHQRRCAPLGQYMRNEVGRIRLVLDQ